MKLSFCIAALSFVCLLVCLAFSDDQGCPQKSFYLERMRAWGSSFLWGQWHPSCVGSVWPSQRENTKVIKKVTAEWGSIAYLFYLALTPSPPLAMLSMSEDPSVFLQACCWQLVAHEHTFSHIVWGNQSWAIQVWVVKDSLLIGKLIFHKRGT